MSGKSKDDRQFELLDGRLIDIQSRLGKIRQTQHEESARDNERFDAIIEMLRNLASMPADLALVKEELSLVHGLVANSDSSQVLTAISKVDGKVDVMSSNIDRLEKEAADAAENVGLVRTAIEELKAASSAMKDEIAALKDQVAKGQLDQGRLDAAVSVFEKADDDIDSIVLPGTPPSPEG